MMSPRVQFGESGEPEPVRTPRGISKPLRNRLCSNDRPRASLAFGAKPDESIDALLQFIDGAGTAALGGSGLQSNFVDRFRFVGGVSVRLRLGVCVVETGRGRRIGRTCGKQLNPGVSDKGKN